jgi:hypothetical protein
MSSYDDETPRQTRARWAWEYLQRAPPEFTPTEEYKRLAEEYKPLPAVVVSDPDSEFWS